MIQLFTSWFVPTEENQISVKTIKGEIASIPYTAVDTIQFLHEKIRDSEGIPVDQQRLYVNYGCGKCWQKQELDDPRDLLVDRLRGARFVTVLLKLKQN